MITVTSEAKEILYEVLEQAKEQSGVTDQDVAIRLAPDVSAANADTGQVQLDLMLDRPQEGDQVVEHNGQKVLVVDESTADLLEGVTLDAVDTPDGRRLSISQ